MALNLRTPIRSFPTRRDARGLGWLGLLVTLAFTFGLWHYFSLELERREADRFRQVAGLRAAALGERMASYERLLRGAASLFAASSTVTRDDWRRYVAELHLETVLPGMQGTGFAVVIPRQYLAEHERAVRADGLPGYAVHPVHGRDVYTSIVYLEPATGSNLRAFGYDMYTDPMRRAAMGRARDTGKAAVTRKVRLVQGSEQEQEPAILMYVPVYARDLPTDTLLDRRRALIGWVYCPFRAGELMRSVFAPVSEETEELIFDGEPSIENLLYASAASGRDAKYTADFPLMIAGTEWTARMRSSEMFEEQADRTRPQVVLLAGLLLSLLIATLLYVDALHMRHLEREVQERTAQLVRARDEAESASRAKTAFLSAVSHELRTPLNAIIGFSSLLVQDQVTPEQRKQLGIINHSGLQLLELIKEILDITSIEAGHLNMEVAPVDVCRVLEEQCEALHAIARNAGLYVRLVECDETLHVMADRVRLGQVVRSLLSNALKFTDRGGVSVRCRREGDAARIEFEDTGIGIAPEHQATLFHPFQRAEKGNQNRPGTALGLAISRRLVEAMGGTIGFESEVDRGSRFWFTVPLAQASAYSASDERRA